MFDDKNKICSKKMFVLIFILQPLFQSAQHFYEKREGSGSVLVGDPDADMGGPKTYGHGISGCVFGTLNFPQTETGGKALKVLFSMNYT